MLASSSFPVGVGLASFGGSRLAAGKRGRTGASLSEIHYTCMHYHTAFSKLSDEQLESMFKSK